MPLLELTFAGEVEAWAHALFVEATHAEMWEGVPTHEENNRYIGYLGTRAKQIFDCIYPCHIIEPERRRVRSSRTMVGGEYLPQYWCAAELYSRGMRDCLVLVWFQDELFPLPSDEIRTKLVSISWQHYAEEFKA